MATTTVRYSKSIKDFKACVTDNRRVQLEPANGVIIMSLGLLLVIVLLIFLFGGFSGRFGGYGYGYGHGGIGVIGVAVIILVALLLTGQI